MKALGLIGLILTLGIIVFLVWSHLTGSNNPQTQIETGQDAIQKANDAANQQNQYNQSIENNLNTGAGVNYHSIYNSIK